MNHGDDGAVGDPVAELCARTAITKAASGTACEVRQPVKIEDPVIDGDALLDSGVTKKVIGTAYARGVAFDGDFAALDAEVEASAIAGFMLEPWLASGENFTSVSIDGLAEYIANDRKVESEFLSNA